MTLCYLIKKIELLKNKNSISKHMLKIFKKKWKNTLNLIENYYIKNLFQKKW